MKLFILRHGMTAASDADERRELSEKGIEEVEKIVRLRRDDLLGVTRIYSSPMKRVKQTLQIAAGILDFQGQIIDSEYLTTGSRLNEIRTGLRCWRHPGEQSPVLHKHSCLVVNRGGHSDTQRKSAGN